MDERIFFPATERNKNYIGDVLSTFLSERDNVLEIASGSGEHGVYFQERFSKVTWQTSDPDPWHLKSISAWINYKGLSKKMPEPLDLDVTKTPWPITDETRKSLKSIICINMIHISPWPCTKALFKEGGNLLVNGCFLMLYGPFKIDGNHISKSNALFDKSLKLQNSSWGIRDLTEVIEIAAINGFKEQEVVQMPANNFSVIFSKI